MTDNKSPIPDTVQDQIRRRNAGKLGFDARNPDAICYLSLIICHWSFTTKLSPQAAVSNEWRPKRFRPLQHALRSFGIVAVGRFFDTVAGQNRVKSRHQLNNDK